jgi:hypothetical protein
MKYYCGLDVSLNSTAACVVNQDGTIIRESEVPSEPAAIDQWLKSLSLPMERVGLEAGGLSSWLCQELLAARWPVICIETRLTEVWKMALADNTVVFDAKGNLKPFEEWPIESRRGLQGLDAEEMFEYQDGEKRQVGVLRKPRFVPKPPWFEMLGKFYKVLERNAERAGENGGSTVTIVQLLQQALLPEGTTRRRIDAETVDVVATPVGDARTDTPSGAGLTVWRHESLPTPLFLL